MAWRIEFEPDAARELRKLDRPVQQRLLGFLRLRVAPLEDPRAVGEALAGQRLGAFWKYRVGDWHLICDIQDERIVVRVLRVGHRREAYR